MLKHLKSLTKAVVSPMLDATGVYGQRIERVSRGGSTWTIVMYHRVIEDAAQDPFGLGMCVQRDRFERQVRWLATHFSAITVADGAARLSRGEPLPERALSITFDDGYLDNLTLALPVLQRCGVPCTVYIPTGGLAEGQPLWWDRVIAALAGTRRASIDLREVGLTDQDLVLPLHGVNAAWHAERVLDALWSLRPAERDRCVDRIVHWLAPADTTRWRAERLSPAQVRELRRQGAEIGAHAVTHPNLSLCDEAQVRSELQVSRATLEDLLQESVTGFAYPGGHQPADAERLCHEAGFAYAVSTEPGVNRAPHARMSLRRIGMPDAEMPDFRRAVSAAMLRGIDDGHVRF